MSRTGLIFIGVLSAAGLVTGTVLARNPQFADTFSLAFSIMLAVGLAVDLAIRRRSQSRQMAPLTMPERAAGVLGGTLIAIGVRTLLSTS